MIPDRSQLQPKFTAEYLAVAWPLVTRIVWGLLLLALLFTPANVKCGEAALTEYQVKALCLVNFARYTEWPATAFSDANAPLIIGIIGESPLQNSLQTDTNGKKIGGRSVVIRRLETEADCDKCQILFVSDSETKRLAEILARVKDKPVLTVGETERFLKEGGIINFAMRNGRVRFDADLNAAHHAGIQISSKVLSLADGVRGHP
jgi:hypothetical protein